MALINSTTTTKKPTHELKSAAPSGFLFPLSRSLTSARSSIAKLTPFPGEYPLTLLRLQVLSCTGLLANDPYVIVSVLNNKDQTPVAQRTLNPTYSPKDATFDFPIYVSLADRLGVLELVVWDKDYLGEAALPLNDWFTSADENNRAYAFDDAGNTVSVLSTLYLGYGCDL
jgi:phosphatidylserine decarboxylase